MNKKLATRDKYLAFLNEQLLAEEGLTEARFAYTPHGATAETANGVGVVGEGEAALLMRMRDIQARAYSDYVVTDEGPVIGHQGAPYGFPAFV